MSAFEAVIHTFTTSELIPVNIYPVEIENSILVIDSTATFSSCRKIRYIIDNKI